MAMTIELIQRLRGRAAFLRDKGRVKSPQIMEQAANELEAHLTQPAQAVDVRAEAYAERLARVLWSQYYAEDAPQWEPLTGDLLGLLSQIDNMTTGLTRALAGEQAGWRVPDGWRLVPAEASPEMLDAAIDAFGGFNGEDEVDAVWAAMPAASPEREEGE